MILFLVRQTQVHADEDHHWLLRAVFQGWHVLFLNHCCNNKNKAKYIYKHFSMTVAFLCTPQARK